MQQTAVEWLEDELGRRQGIIDSEPDGLVKKTMYENLYLDLFEEVKEMEKEQIIDTYKKAQILMVMDSSKQAEQYYNETFNKE